MKMPTPQSRALGSIWGVCIGDALGGPVQFEPKGTFEPVRGLRAVEPFRQPAGSYSDDGSMTLALSQSLVDTSGEYNHIGSIRYFVEWLHSGRFSTTNTAWDVGMSTRRALRIWGDKMDLDPNVNRNPEESRTTTDQVQGLINQNLDVEEASGNGSLMRIAPVGVVLWREAEKARRCARTQSCITHPALGCVEACEVYTELMCRGMRGESKDVLAQLLSTATTKLTHPALSHRLLKYKTVSAWKSTPDTSMHSSGWVVDTLEAALWAFFKYDSFAEGALAVVNLGGDADTAGAVYGGLAGMFYGFEGIPAEWVGGMRNRGVITAVAEGVAGLV